MPEVRLTSGKVALVDEDDYERVVDVGMWSVEVDHINHNGLDNRKANLRIVTKSENQRGRSRNANKKSSFYKGVFYDPSPRGKRPWRVKIGVGGVLRSFGRYATEEEAASVYDQRASELFGEHAKLNLKGVT